MKDYYESKVYDAIDRMSDSSWDFKTLQKAHNSSLNDKNNMIESIAGYLSSDSGYNQFMGTWTSSGGAPEDFYKEEYSKLDISSPEFTKAFISNLPHGATFPATTKVPLKLQRLFAAHNTVDVPPGTEVEIFAAHETLLIDWRNERRDRYSKEPPIKTSEVFDYLDVDLHSWINSNWGKRFKEQYEYTSQMFGGNRKKPASKKEMYARGEKNQTLVEEAMENVLRRSLHSYRYELNIDFIFESCIQDIKVWTTWQNLIARGRDFRYIYDFLIKKFLRHLSYDDDVINSYFLSKPHMNQIKEKSKKEIGSPSFEDVRREIARTIDFPSGYSVNNARELWAVTIEQAVMGTLKNQELIKLIQSIIDGTYTSQVKAFNLKRHVTGK